MRMKKLITSALAIALTLSMATPALACPAKPDDRLWSFYGDEYDGTWKSVAHIIEPNLPKPSDWAANEVYAAAAQYLTYMPEYNAKTDTMSAEFKSWQANMTRDDFAETVYSAIDRMANYMIGQNGAKWNEAIYNGGNFVNPTFKDFVNRWTTSFGSKYNVNEMEASAIKYGEYVNKGGKLSADDYLNYIQSYDTSYGNLTRYYKFNDFDNLWIEKLASEGIVTANNGNFNPTALITRQDAAVIIVNACEKMGIPMEKSTTLYSDDASIPDWAKDAVYKVLSIKDDNGLPIMQSVGNNTFNPSATLTNEQGQVIAVRLFYAAMTYANNNI